MNLQSENLEVQKFIGKIMMLDHEKYQLLEVLRKVVFGYYPKVKEKMMYGGIIFTGEEDWGGVFVYKNHVSFEFSNGITFKDPNELLEGSGKHRRHLKIKTMDSEQMKKAGFYVKQAQ